MHYEHTTKAIIGLILGVLLFADSFLVSFVGVQWLPFGAQPTNILIEMLYQLIPIGLFAGPVLIALGILGIRRELWVRSLERQARG